MKDLVLALDLGTTGNRAVVFDRELRVVAHAYREFPQLFPAPGWVEHEPERLWSSALECLREAASAAGAERIAAVGVANQRETAVVWDRRTSQPLARAIVWQDRRTAEACAALKARGAEPRVRERTGLLLDPYFSATKWRWLLDRVPAVAATVRSGDAAFGTIDSWAVWKLTGGRVHATDPSNASRTLLYATEERRWDPELGSIFGVPLGPLPEVRPTVGSFGSTDASIAGFSAPILAVAGDQQAALFGQGGFSPAAAKNTYGTGLFAMINTGRRRAASERLLSTIAWEIGGTVEYALEGSVFVGGAAVQWLRDGLGFFRSSAEIEALAASVPDSGGVTFIPALAGLGAPHWDPEARGALFGLTRGTTRAHIARATLDALAFQTVDVVREMELATGRPVLRLQADGGACADDLLMQLQADALGVPVERPEILESTALGVAGLAGLGAGLWPDREAFAAKRRVERVFEPRISAAERERARERWLWAVDRTLSRSRSMSKHEVIAQ